MVDQLHTLTPLCSLLKLLCLAASPAAMALALSAIRWESADSTTGAAALRNCLCSGGLAPAPPPACKQLTCYTICNVMSQLHASLARQPKPRLFQASTNRWQTEQRQPPERLMGGKITCRLTTILRCLSRHALAVLHSDCST